MTIKQVERTGGGTALVTDAVRVEGATTGQALVHDGVEFVPTTIPTLATLSDNNPAALSATADPGVGTRAARDDHTHPTDNLALLAGSAFSGACTFNDDVTLNQGATVATSKSVAGAAELTLGAAAGQSVRVSIGGSEKVRVVDDSLLIGHTTSPGAGAKAIVLPNSADGGYYVALSSGGTPTPLAQLTGADTLQVGSAGVVDLYYAGTGQHTWDAGGSERMRLGTDGGLLVGITTALGAAGIGLANNAALEARTNSGTWRSIAIIPTGSDAIFFGDTAAAVALRGGAVSVESSDGFLTLEDLGLQLSQIADPGNAPAGKAWLFLRDNAGKGQLCVRFPSGAVQVIAGEP